MWLAAYWIRFNFDVSPEFLAASFQALAWVMPLYAAIYLKFGLYRGIWRYASMGDLRRLLIAVGLGAMATAGVVYMIQAPGVPRSVLLLHPILLLLAMGGSRFLYRAWKDGHLLSSNLHEGQPVLVLGAGDAAAMLLKDLSRSSGWRVVGLLDDDAAKHGRRLADVPILGPLASVAGHAGRFGVTHAIIAMPSSSAGQRRRAAELAGAAGLIVLTVPAMADVLSGKVSVSQVRKVELEDLLGRDPIQLDDEGLHRLLTGRCVLVTGAGGSIGSELCRQIAHYAPARLVFFEQSEFVLYRIEQEFAAQFPEVGIACLVGDVKDEASLGAAFAAHRPEVVFHAAAYKHVPLMENENAWQAVRNNVLGTLRVARAAMAAGVGKFVMVSTDKAVNPTNVMGASKRLAEMVCQALQTESPNTHFVTVRFGNVLGSSGSVIPRFREQIARGGPVTVTHPDIIRYFMLIPEAAQLVLQAGLMGQGGEIYVLDMGEPVKIVDLARDMIRLSGYSEEEVKIVFTGLRPGEKLFEELLADGEHTLPTPHPKLRIARAQAALSAEEMADLLAWLRGAPQEEQDVKQRLMRFVPEYRPRQTE
ncbi:MAG TPA: nucleoside-diphosphate sugar epimerase/dehydratase [Candidatus Desulfobacillus denitrificans]|nr:nucleoside-diphosphate sugar epimerase/dehydratase [Candidatus Desulfobacillus denitrificans]